MSNRLDKNPRRQYQRLKDKLEVLISQVIFLTTLVTLSFLITASTALDSTSPPSSALFFGDAVAEGEIGSWEAWENQRRMGQWAKKFSQQLKQREIFNAEGKLIQRLLPDGRQEQISYGQPSGRICIQVTDANGRFQSERTYYQNKLQSILYLDGSWRKLYYLRELKNPLWWQIDVPSPSLPGVWVFFFSRGEVQIILYDVLGRFMAESSPAGKEIVTSRELTAQELYKVIPEELLTIHAAEYILLP